MSVEASCHCGAVRLVLDTAPATVTECNCSLCRRYGVLWAYYSPSQVTLIPPTPPTATYLWNGRNVAFHHCTNCGCVTHWSSVNPKRDRMGINARLLEPSILEAAERHYLDKQDRPSG
jgi:hypothetical protein